MLVKNWMSKNVVTVDVDDSMQHAMNLAREHKFRMFPVLSEGKLVGVLSDSDIRKASPSKASLLDVHELAYLISKIRVREIMTKEPVTVPPDFTVEETAKILMDRGISGVPVVEPEGCVVGIITRDDLFRVLVSLSGLAKKGIQFAFQFQDTPGSIKAIYDVIQEFGGRIASMLSTVEDSPAGHKTAYFRVYDIDRQKLDQLKDALMKKSRLLHVIDHRECKREILCEPD